MIIIHTGDISVGGINFVNAKLEYDRKKQYNFDLISESGLIYSFDNIIINIAGINSADYLRLYNYCQAILAMNR